jgi:hypothetical protein
MSSAALKEIAIGCLCLMAACPQSFALGMFPTEQELQANIRRDMTPAQVVAFFGEPSGGMPEHCQLRNSVSRAHWNADRQARRI